MDTILITDKLHLAETAMTTMLGLKAAWRIDHRGRDNQILHEWFKDRQRRSRLRKIIEKPATQNTKQPKTTPEVGRADNKLSQRSVPSLRPSEILTRLQTQFGDETLSKTPVYEWHKRCSAGPERVENEQHDRRL
ncbi:hypothetical protein NQ318_017834 [Aromia moschata]|uniref:Transposase n=1 Tax=Aromia moschata TaxID=1265417 RepID=A0AAV8YGT0_9CUCU|nr:hypothetical protein NQ318_017834 [Aromia moschata]